ncbi:hypothetical protein [Pseudonocardia acaciae]|nr:hypothetical protein [Pseudonocardia acaciae]
MSGAELLHHLLVDYLIKGGIVVVGLLLLVIGMVVVWRKLG